LRRPIQVERQLREREREAGGRLDGKGEILRAVENSVDQVRAENAPVMPALPSAALRVTFPTVVPAGVASAA